MSLRQLILAYPEAFHRPRVVFASDDKTGSDSISRTGAESSQQQDSLSENPQSPSGDQFASYLAPHTSALLGLTPAEQISASADDRQTFNAARWETRGYIPPLAGGAPTKPEGLEKSKKHQNRRADSGPTGFWVTELEDVNPLEDFSENGHWLYRKLVGLPEGLEMDMLQVLAQKSGHDLQSAIDELKKFNFIDDTKLGELRLTAMKFIPYDTADSQNS